MTTWSNARSTLGQGTPQRGAQFDNSNQLRQLQSDVESAAPGERWTGSAADSYAEANSNQGRVLGQMAGLDQRLGAEVDRSAAVVAAGRRNLDEVKQWVLDAASSVPQTPDREQQLLPIARRGIGDVADVLTQSNTISTPSAHASAPSATNTKRSAARRKVRQPPLLRRLTLLSVNPKTKQR